MIIPTNNNIAVMVDNIILARDDHPFPLKYREKELENEITAKAATM